MVAFMAIGAIFFELGFCFVVGIIIVNIIDFVLWGFGFRRRGRKRSFNIGNFKSGFMSSNAFLSNIFRVNGIYKRVKRKRRFKRASNMFDLSFVSKVFQFFGETFYKYFIALEIYGGWIVMTPAFFTSVST